MGERPLPDEVARIARAYLAALVSPSARADAWHDLLAEVRYWQDDGIVPVLHLAHQVVGQHERVTDEAAAHALVDVGIDDVQDLAVVLTASLDTARDLRDRVARVHASGERADLSGGRMDRPATVTTQAVAAEPQNMVDPTPTEATAPTSPSSPDASVRSTTAALRIGFDNQDAVETDDSEGAPGGLDDAGDWDDEPSPGLLTYRRLVGIAVVVWVLVVLTRLLGGS